MTFTNMRALLSLFATTIKAVTFLPFNDPVVAVAIYTLDVSLNLLPKYLIGNIDMIFIVNHLRTVKKLHIWTIRNPSTISLYTTIYFVSIFSI